MKEGAMGTCPKCGSLDTLVRYLREQDALSCTCRCCSYNELREPLKKKDRGDSGEFKKVDMIELADRLRVKTP